MPSILTSRRPHGRARLGLAALVACLALVACGERDAQRVLFDGVYFRTKVDGMKDDRQNFNIRVPKPQRSIAGAREAGRYEGTRYCLKNFGTSDIRWTLSPDAEDGRLVIDGNNMRFSGRCLLW